ncbi:MAG: helix-turn-helix transcriptional regulator [bacterium]|nr:helix-turn-helix transcriptional regulator [bacterium]
MVVEIGQRLKKLREQFKYSHEQMSGKLGLSKSGYFKNEGGIRFPGFKTLDLLQKNWDISMDWLIFNKGPVHYKEKMPEPAPQPEKVEVKETTGLEDIGPDVRELVEYMEQDHLLKHEVLLNFYKYKEKKEQDKKPQRKGAAKSKKAADTGKL